ncbi:hypothetical protein [Humisphaera borealis]|uniref:Uncharacterized protein n=1 Tax=Humisphaera borealis TaxID=2807512 RepID=A0A7M2X1A4_9BACT|nr:hypothetical protein [Humisphaera borealis]QOV90901.1 hypothetical protein IPV69_05945 [Humisphaera borealis]
MRHDDEQSQRDAWLCRRLIDSLALARDKSPTGDRSGPSLKREAQSGEPHDGGFDSDDHCLRLCRDLRDWGLVVEQVGTIRRIERFGLEHVTYRLSDKGLQLVREQIPPMPGVWDERL